MMQKDHPPIFNLPMPIKVLVAVMVLLHLPRQLGLAGLSNSLFEKLAFVPLRYADPAFWWNDPLASMLSPIGHTFLHADWIHLLLNIGMLIAFGKALWLFCGERVFWAVYCLGALSGALVVAVTTDNPSFPLIGASAAVSAMVGAMCSLGIVQKMPLPFPFDTARRSGQLLVVWIGLNLLIALLPSATFASDTAIAWNAHLAGLAVGFSYIWLGLRDFRLRPPS